MAKKEEKKYGDFDSVEELNQKAAELATNEAELNILAQENGIDLVFVEMLLHHEMDVLVPDAMTAAIGKLDVEVAALDSKNQELGQGIAEYLKQKAMEDEQLARAIRKNGKKLEDVCKKAWDEASKRKQGNCAYIPPFEIFQMARAYYMEV